MKHLTLTLALVLAQHCIAAADVWKGEGSLFKLNGESEGSYSLTVKNTRNGSVTESEITVALANGAIINLQCTNTAGEGESWSSLCGHGKGGGRCLGEGLCISYLEGESGKAFATTIAMDGPSDMRLLRTELKDGKAVRFFREKLHRQ